jgi:hypothetical protein
VTTAEVKRRSESSSDRNGAKQFREERMELTRGAHGAVSIDG